MKVGSPAKHGVSALHNDGGLTGLLEPVTVVIHMPKDARADPSTSSDLTLATVQVVVSEGPAPTDGAGTKNDTAWASARVARGEVEEPAVPTNAASCRSQKTQTSAASTGLVLLAIGAAGSVLAGAASVIAGTQETDGPARKALVIGGLILIGGGVFGLAGAVREYGLKVWCPDPADAA